MPRRAETRLEASRIRVAAAVCLATVLLCFSLAAQSQAQPRRGGAGLSEAERERRQEERERAWERRQEIREADEERARSLGGGSSYNRQREDEERERARQWERERGEVDARNRALRESYEREAEQNRRALREIEERERRAREAAARKETPEAPQNPRERSSPPPRVSSAGTLSCAAQPYCPRADGYGNACKSVTASVASRPQIIQLCQQANTPEPCGAGLSGDSEAKGRYMANFGGGCARQCAAVAECRR